MQNLKTYTLIIISLCLVVGSEAKTRKQVVDVLQAVRFGNCDNYFSKNPDYSYFENITITNIGKGRNSINGQFVNRYPAKKTTATYKIFNCRSDLDSDCELFGSYTHSDYCATATEPGQFYSTIYSAFHPLLTCPLKKMVYQIQNATVDADATLKLGKLIPSMRSLLWMAKTKMIAIPENKEFGCMVMMFKFAQIRI